MSESGTMLTISVAMIEEVMKEWEREHPGCKAELHMPKEEFADRMMRAIQRGAKLIHPAPTGVPPQ